MSHTDKTRPVWVQFRDPDNRHLMIEVHNHETGVCDLDEWMEVDVTWHWATRTSDGRRFNCYLYKSYYEMNRRNFWPRPRKGSWDRTGRHTHVRTLWRKQRQLLLKGVIEDSDKPNSKWYKRDMWNEWSM